MSITLPTRGHATLVNDATVTNVRVTEESLSVTLSDGRVITTPLSWYPRLATASPEAQANWEICGAGEGIHWPELDEDLSIEGMLRGQPSVELRHTTSI